MQREIEGWVRVLQVLLMKGYFSCTASWLQMMRVQSLGFSGHFGCFGKKMTDIPKIL